MAGFNVTLKSSLQHKAFDDKTIRCSEYCTVCETWTLKKRKRSSGSWLLR